MKLPLAGLLILLSVTGAAQGDPVERALVARVREDFPAALELLARSVDQPSATENLAGVRAMSRIYEPELAALGFEARWVPLAAETGRAGHLVAERPGSRVPALLLIGHLDTVLEGEPYRREGDTAYGSGIADMKGGNLVILAALRALHEEGLLEDRSITVVFTGDEESPGAPVEVCRRALVEAAARSDVALAFEGGEQGTAVVGRRGIDVWRLETTGRTGHSSTIFSEARGSGAVFEAARVLAAFHDELREPDLTFNASVILGGSAVEHDPAEHAGSARGKTNVVPDRCVVEGDLRFLTSAQRELAHDRMRRIVAASLPGTSAQIVFEERYPSMAPTPGNEALLATLDAVSRELGYGLVRAFDPGRRGAGDISFVAALVDGLDGLGAIGEHSHAPGERIDVPKLRMQIERTAVLLHRLTR